MTKETGNPIENLDIDVILDRKPIQFDLENIARHLHGKSLLITGAGGSIGSSLSDLLLGLNPSRLILVEHHENSLYLLRQRLEASKKNVECNYVLADVRDKQKITRIFRKYSPQFVFHLAAYKHVPMGEDNPDEVVTTNIFGSLNVAEAAIESGIERMVFPSTDKAVNPPSIYGATKRVVELMLREKQRELERPIFTIVRLVNTIGAQGGVIRLFAQQMLSGMPVTLTDEAMIRYWISMKEATLFIAQASTFRQPEGILLLDMGQPQMLKAVAERLWRYLGFPAESLDLSYIGMRPGERLEEELHYSFESLRETTHPGILEVIDRSQESRPVVAAISGLKDALDAIDDQLLKRELFRLATPL